MTKKYFTLEANNVLTKKEVEMTVNLNGNPSQTNINNSPNAFIGKTGDIPKSKATVRNKKTGLIVNIAFGLLLSAGLLGTSVYFAIKTDDNYRCAPPTNNEIRGSADLYNCELNDIKLWRMLFVIMTAGAAGGLVFELLNLKGNIEWPHGPSKDELAAKFAYATPDNLYDLGYLARLIIGALSAPLAIATIQPNFALAILTTSVVAGSSGALIFRSLQDRLVAAIYQKEIDDRHTEFRIQTQKLQSDTELIKGRLNEACDAFTKLKNKIITESSLSSGIVTFPSDPKAVLDIRDLDKVWVPLKVAEGVAEGVAPQTLDTSKKLQQSMKSAVEAFAKLQAALCGVAESPPQNSLITLMPNKTIDPEYFNQVQKFLSEAKAVIEAIVSSGSNPPE